jgi:hypothetical protein
MRYIRDRHGSTWRRLTMSDTTTQTTPTTAATPDTTTPAGGKTFTQAELDAVIADRLARERDKFKDFEALKTKAAKLDELEKANLTEAEKLKADLAAAQAAGAERISRAQALLLKAEVKSVAAELGIVDADAAFALMDRANVKVEDNDSVTGVKPALEALLAAKPYLKAAAQTTVGGATNPGEGGAGAATLEAQLDEAVKAGNFRLQVNLQRQIAERNRKGS